MTQASEVAVCILGAGPVGATLAATLAAAGLPVALWLRLRPLLYFDLLRSTLLVLTMVFAIAPLADTRDKSRPPLNIVLMLAALAAVMRLSLDTGPLRSLPIPPLWFATLLAVVAVADYWRRARAVLSPGRETAAP